jgi:hypothetical protein
MTSIDFIVRLLRGPLTGTPANVRRAALPARRIRTFNVGAVPMFIRVFLLATIAAPVAAQVPPTDSAWLVATTQSLLTGLVNWRDNNPVAWRRER